MTCLGPAVHSTLEEGELKPGSDKWFWGASALGGHWASLWGITSTQSSGGGRRSGCQGLHQWTVQQVGMVDWHEGSSQLVLALSEAAEAPQHTACPLQSFTWLAVFTELLSACVVEPHGPEPGPLGGRAPCVVIVHHGLR